MSPRKKQKPAGPDTNAKACKSCLSHESIMTAALQILDRDGFEALSMRRLGKELGVDPMAIYYHIPNKAALLDALVEVVMKEIDTNVDDPTRSIPDRLFTAAQVYREALLAHPSLIPAVANRPPRTMAALKPVDVLLGIFLDAGFDADAATSAMNIFAIFVRGAVIREAAYLYTAPGADTVEDVNDYSKIAAMLPAEEFPNLSKVAGKACFAGFDEEFERGSKALIRGLLETYGNKEEVEHDV
jgi:AcrR family transcriptional regulator